MDLKKMTQGKVSLNHNRIITTYLTSKHDNGIVRKHIECRHDDRNGKGRRSYIYDVAGAFLEDRDRVARI